MELFTDLIKVVFRIFTILPLMLLVGIYMGKRSIGELPIFDFLVVLTLGSVVGADIADPNINHVHTIGAIISIAILQKIIVRWKIRNRTIGRLLTFEPTLVVHNGKFLVENMKKINYSIDNVLQMLRQKDVFHVADVQLAFIESNGELSVKLISPKEHVRTEHVLTNVPESGIEIPVILEGNLYVDALEYQGLNEAWLRQKLLQEKIANVHDVFYASINSQNELHISLKTEQSNSVPIYH
ncbi:DUF421 domain-containing protein [Sutcliffiella cohnii]|uniref:DUF421 domain-containing protein n=2 Tax=Sutcliffiella cohnii TaxID=33932 RepID=UPI002E24467D|nr:DUF421 domain-containing protein [Sutcliffiella cohnii]